MKKKLITLFLTFALLFSLSFTCFASELILDGEYDVSNMSYPPTDIIISNTRIVYTRPDGKTVSDYFLVLKPDGLYTRSGVGSTWKYDFDYIIFDNQVLTDEVFYNAFAKAYPQRVKSADFISVLDNATEQITVSTVVGVLVFVLGACVGLVFMWWGIRKLVRAVMSAFKKGKVSL